MVSTKVVMRRAWPALTLLALFSSCKSYDASLLAGGRSPGTDSGIRLPYEENCGNGLVDVGERCDTALPEGAEGGCPTSCPSEDPCYISTIAGSDCQSECVGLPIVKALNDDGCCAMGVGPGEDSDCGGCGDGIVGPKETCEGNCQGPEECSSVSACLVGVFTGSAETCTSQCHLERIQDCKGGDQCCPANCTPELDSDCSSTCGNGMVEAAAGETCEEGSATPCRTSCDDGTACTTDLLTGSASNCNVDCTYVGVLAPVGGDGCCPDGANAYNDSDCLPRCGNSVREGSETCDPCTAGCADEDPCTVDASTGSADDCTMQCTHTPVTEAMAGDACCPPGENAASDSDCDAVCGNAIQEPAEQCDPCPANCDDGDACTTDGQSGSSAACDLSCSHDAITTPQSGDGCCPGGATSLNDDDCAPVCGNGLVEAGEGCDGQGYCGSGCTQVLPTSIVHRYRFNGSGTTVTDSAGSAHGTVQGASLSGSGTVVLSGGASGPYVDLPDGIISSLTNATVEMWLTWRGGNSWQRAFDFGNSSGGQATSEWFITPSNSSSHVDMVMNFTSTVNDTANDRIAEDDAPLSQNVMHQLVGVFDDSGDIARVYVDGSQVASRSILSTQHLSQIDDNNVWIGRSNYNNDRLKATVHEFRIYSSALSASQISANNSAGPDP